MTGLEQLKSTYVLTGQSVHAKNPPAIRKSIYDIFELARTFVGSNIAKEDRWFVSQSIKEVRPKLDNGYTSWSGLVVFDLDIKNKVAAAYAKSRLAKMLSKQPWFAGAVFSTSHSGVHLYTMCKPDQTIINADMYMDHIEAMSTYVWQALIVIYKLAVAENKLDAKDINDLHPVFNMSSRKEKNGKLTESNLFDLATFKLSQPILIGYDPDVIINDNFDNQPPLGFSPEAYKQMPDCTKLKEMFDRKRGRSDAPIQKILNIDVNTLPTVEQCMPRSYDNTARYRLAYTIASIYDVNNKNSEIYQLMKACFLRMCSGNPKYRQEKHAFAAVFDSAVQRQAAGICPQIAWAVNELKTVHHFDIEVEMGVEAQQQMLNVDINVELAKPVFIPPELNIVYDNIYELEQGQYVADGTAQLLEQLQAPNSKMLLVAEPGTGKTVFATNLMQQTKLRVLCVVPYISVIESKFKTLPPEANCQCCYGFNSFDATVSRNAVVTFDKFSRMSMPDLDLCFDIIVLDESHVLQMSAYRSLVPAECIDRLRNTKTPCVLMTGTPIAEHMFVNLTSKVMFKRSRATDKLFSLVVCNTSTERFCQAILHISNSIRIGRKVIFPTNEGNSYAEKVVHAVEQQLKRPINWKYYKKEFADQTFMFEVNRNQTIGDIELLFCSAYLSVGVDINDFYKFDLVYTEDFSAHEIEQFNNRLRKVDLASYYFIAKYANDGYAKPNCFANLVPNLRVSRLRQMELHDLLALQTIAVDEEGKVSKLFDYFARHMRMPWLLRQPDGTVKLHSTCYSLWVFEETWRKWAVQVPILVQQLRQYNYQINVINTELLDNDSAAQILDSAREGLHDYKDRINDDIQFILKLMQNKDFYDVLVYSNAIRLVTRQYQGLVCTDDNHVNVYVSNVAQCYRFIRSIRMLSKYYTRQTVLSLYDTVHNSLAKFEHVFQTVELLDYAANDRLSNANVDAIRYVLYTMFDSKRSIQMSKKQYQHHLQEIVKIYRDVYDLQAQTIIDKITVHADGMIKRLAMKITAYRGDTAMNLWQLKTIPAFDSSAMINLETQKTIILNMFKMSIFEVNEQNKTSEDVSGFFKHNEQMRESDSVQVIASINALKELNIKNELSPAMKQSLKRYIESIAPMLLVQDIIVIMKRINLDGDLNYYKQIDILVKQYLEEQSV